MKTIKFRVWFKVEFRYLSNDEFAFFFDNGGSVEVWAPDMDGDHTSYETNLVEVEQFTGLKDMEGIEIYEGDILQGYDRDGDSQGRPHEVVFNRGSFCVDLGYVGLRPFSAIDKVRWEVIGNIHENKELLQC